MRPKDMKEHGPGCVYPKFRHRLACTCPGSIAWGYLSRGRPGEYDPSLGERAEMLALAWRKSQGFDARLAREIYSCFPNPALANAYSGDILGLSFMTEFSDEVKEITGRARQTGNVLVNRFAIEAAFERVLAVDVERREISVIPVEYIRERLDRLDEWIDPRTGRTKVKVPIDLCISLVDVRHLALP